MMKKVLISVIISVGACMGVSAQTDSVSLRQNVSADVKAPAGKYIYVPDSLQGDVLRLLKGKSKVVDDDAKMAGRERVVVNGDTVPMMLRSRNLGRFDRGLSNYLYIPKGKWNFGLTASYGEISTEDLQLFGLLTDVDIFGSMFSIKPYISYFLRNNMSVGLRFGYTSGYAGVNSLRAGISDDMNFNIDDVKYKNENYTAAFTFRQYVGLGRRSRFGVFNEVELALGSGHSSFERPYAGEIKRTETKSIDAQLNFSPGVQILIMKNVDFHLSFGVFGFYLTHEKQTEDGIPSGERTTSGANFRFNIFNLNFGIGVII